MICISCKKDKDISNFEWQKDRPNPRKVCKECRYSCRNREKEKIRHREYQKEQRRLNPDKVRRTWEKSTYGLCKEDLGITNCMICGSQTKLCIDHCHTTSEVRGILCSKCNIGLGMFNDNIEVLSNAIKYLRDGPHFQIEE